MCSWVLLGLQTHPRFGKQVPNNSTAAVWPIHCCVMEGWFQPTVVSFPITDYLSNFLASVRLFEKYPNWIQPPAFLKRLGVYLCIQQLKILLSYVIVCMQEWRKIKADSFHRQEHRVSQARRAGGAKARFHCTYTNNVSVETTEAVVLLLPYQNWQNMYLICPSSLSALVSLKACLPFHLLCA